ncbi:cytochrome c peroxidase [uncultured Winogradskyella sp.]|uniref:cytochrome-c peroxidase n=1 Tax=uncultured Winogradskyella sp. TaxID=395353 RepID=UPI0030DA9269|tara:strand:- start:20539 stop:21717 length:1179 start_codon:yes stop_codon:yes gene_type:complete
MQKSLIAVLALLIFGCASEDTSSNPALEADILDLSTLLSIDFNALDNYSDQLIPPYITRDNTPSDNFITDEGATLGRILFYDTNLSTDNTVSCASCHKQNFAFGDNLSVSVGLDGTTGRHSMRLINSRFSDENNFFWDERANSLEVQTTMPIKDHIEMGFSGEDGDLDFTDLIARLENTDYYPQLFNLVYGEALINETKIQNALAQFVRSIQSFDSKYDEGRLLLNNDNQPFPNFTQQENLGKQLFLQPPVFDNQGSRINGGIGCAGCHQAPEFSIDPNSLNNGVIGTASQTGTDLTVTRSPSLRDVVKADGTSNGQFMHIGVSNNLATVMNHYDEINLAGNTNLDPRLRPNGVGQQLNLTDNERNAVIAFIRTLAGNDVYTNTKWSTPFIN